VKRSFLPPPPSPCQLPRPLEVLADTHTGTHRPYLNGGAHQASSNISSMGDANRRREYGGLNKFSGASENLPAGLKFDGKFREYCKIAVIFGAKTRKWIWSKIDLPYKMKRKINKCQCQHLKGFIRLTIRAYNLYIFQRRIIFMQLLLRVKILMRLRPWLRLLPYWIARRNF
jgi:hypothetical protein